MNIVNCHHEQACSIAAESYSRITNKLSIVNVTTGPGGINAINGVFGAWTDSIPMLIVSGQVKRETLVSTYGVEGGWRQLGDQEVDIVNMVKGITKYSILLTDPKMIKYHLKKAIYLAMNGRRGPCWIDVPIDLQAMQIDENDLIDFDSNEFESDLNIHDSLNKNIALGLMDADIDYNRIQSLISICKLDNLVNNLPNGADSFIGEKAIRISGGEAQRIGIARALYFNKEIIIFDEFTSALDSKTEDEILEIIKSLNKTIILVSHKKSVIKICEQVFEINKSKFLN
jgi:hypothetical protein